MKIWQMEAIESTHGTVEEPLPKTLNEDLLIGLLETGTVRAHYRRATHILGPGTLILCQPGETVAFEPLDGATPVRVCIRCPRSELEDVAGDVLVGRAAMPFFSHLITPDPRLALLVRRFQGTLERPTSRLESSSRARDMLSRIVRRHSGGTTSRVAKAERALVRRAREYLDEHVATEITLSQLARLANSSPFHLNRVFRAEVGLPPHAYQTQRRIVRSKALLAQGQEIGQVALDLGFYDQSHFTNQFKRLTGYTPGVYRASVLGRR
jgi:AraC-like DNA-binding protein